LGGDFTQELMFSLNATVPIFLLMVLGYVLHRYTKLLNDEFARYLDMFVFRVALPVQLFKNLSESDFRSVWNGRAVLFCFVVTALSILLALAASFRLKDPSLRGEFTQVSFRGSQALLGGALMQNVYGNIGPLALGLLGTAPLYNVAAVVILTLLGPEGHLDRRTMKKTLWEIVTNPIIVSIAVGLVWSLLKIPQPVILQKSVSNIAATAAPLGLLALGACVDLEKLKNCWNIALAGTIFKLVVFGVLFLPVAVWLGFRGEMLLVILIVVASPPAVACFNMARGLGHEGTLSAGVVMLSAICSAFTLTGWLYLLRTFALI